MEDERRGHAHHSPKSLSIKASSDHVGFPIEESNPRPIENSNDSGDLEHSNTASYELSQCPFISIYEFHYFALPVQNEGLLRQLYLEMDFSSYQISEISGWSRTSISDALRELNIKKETKKGPLPQYGMKKEGATHVVHKGEQKVISQILSLRNTGLSFDAIANKLNKENIPSKFGSQWNKSTVKEIIKREQKRKV